MERDPDFARAWAVAAEIPGWLTPAQGVALWQGARGLHAGAHIVEIGSHRGRSTVVLGLAARQVGARITAVDPFVDGALFGGEQTRTVFEENIRRADLGDTVTLVPEYSTRLRRRWAQPIDLLYIDGKHDYWTVTDDLLWSRQLPPGAEFFVHDCFSSVGVTSGVLRQVLMANRYVYTGRTGSLARFRIGVPTGADRIEAVRELPWFARNVGIKSLLRLRLRPIARRLGHGHQYDPY
jgi:predicted O-methyltransferase YrrM